MGSLWKEANRYFSSTSIHGFSYISDTQSRSTRIIWTVIVLAGLGGASYFLYESVKGFGEKYVSTTIETRSIQEFPFPAVTFHPGDFNSKEAFKRTFLNQFEFTRYDETSQLRNNEDFRNLYQWLTSPMNNELFDSIENYLIKDKEANIQNKSFLKRNGKNVKNEACPLVFLKIARISMKKVIRDIFVENLYKFTGFRDLRNVIRNQVGPIIKGAVAKYNVTKSEILKVCNDLKNQDIKTEMEAMLLSYMYLYIDTGAISLGAGDLATGPFASGLNRGKPGSDFNHYYLATHTLLTQMYNEMVNGSLPLSVFEFPTFFTLPDNAYFEYKEETNEVVAIVNNKIELLNMNDESMRNYHYYWYSYNNNLGKLILLCKNNKKTNCSNDKLKYNLAIKEELNGFINIIRKNPEEGKLVESNVSNPPCADEEIVQMLKLEQICKFLRSVSGNRHAFMKLMKFTKQSPVYLEDDEEHTSVFNKDVMKKFEFIGIDNHIRSNAFISMCSFEGNPKEMKLDNCKLFKRSFTNKGIGYTFNNEIESTLMKRDLYSQTLYPNTKREPSLMISASSEHSLKVIIENNKEEVKRYEDTIDVNKAKGTLHLKPIDVAVSLHNPKEPADIRSSSFKIPLGHSSTIYITPKAREIDESGKELTEFQRNCRLGEDTSSLDVFNVYTQTACLLECKMRHSLKMCGCLPWDYPVIMKGNVKPLFCDIYGNQCFENNMKNISIEKTCNCPIECSSIGYSFSIVSTPFDSEGMCPRNVGSEEFLMKQFYENQFPTKYVRKLIEFKKNVSSDEDENCKNNIQYRAEVIFRLATNTMSVTVMSKRLSFFDQLSTFGICKVNLFCALVFILNHSGGILGLFTGISILSMVEVTFWIVRFLVNRGKHLRKQK